MNQPVYIVRHARNRMRWRNISKEEVIYVLENSELIEDDIKNRKNVFATVNGRYLKVTFVEEKGTIVVVSVVEKE